MLKKSYGIKCTGFVYVCPENIPSPIKFSEHMPLISIVFLMF